SSFDSVKGPSVTVTFPPESRTRAPFELGWRPSVASSTPAFVISSRNFPIFSMSSLLAGPPASERLSALSSPMNRVVVSPSGLGFGAGHPDGFDRLSPGSTYTSNKGQRDRQV